MDQFLTYKRQILDQFLTLQYIYIYIYFSFMLWSYYLGHVWGGLMVTNWATFVFLTLLTKSTIKIRVSADLFFNGHVADFKVAQTWPS